MKTPNINDMKMYNNGVLYVRSHFVTVPLSFKCKEELDFLAKEHNSVNTHILNNLYNVMFHNADDAKAFAEKANE
jgi:hypothetical protein